MLIDVFLEGCGRKQTPVRGAAPARPSRGVVRRIGVLGDSRTLPCVRLTWRWSNGLTRASSDSASAEARRPDARGDCLVPDLRIDLADESLDKARCRCDRTEFICPLLTPKHDTQKPIQFPGCLIPRLASIPADVRASPLDHARRAREGCECERALRGHVPSGISLLHPGFPANLRLLSSAADSLTCDVHRPGRRTLVVFPLPRPGRCAGRFGAIRIAGRIVGLN
jgi:hypothetical protein